jgi:hypothetical protein
MEYMRQWLESGRAANDVAAVLFGAVFVVGGTVLLLRITRYTYTLESEGLRAVRYVAGVLPRKLYIPYASVLRVEVKDLWRYPLLRAPFPLLCGRLTRRGVVITRRHRLFPSVVITPSEPDKFVLELRGRLGERGTMGEAGAGGRGWS